MIWIWGVREKNQGRPHDFGLSTFEYAWPSIIMQKAGGEVGFGVEGQESSFGYVVLRYQSGDGEEAAR